MGESLSWLSTVYHECPSGKESPMLSIRGLYEVAIRVKDLSKA